MKSRKNATFRSLFCHFSRPEIIKFSATRTLSICYENRPKLAYLRPIPYLLTAARFSDIGLSGIYQTSINDVSPPLQERDQDWGQHQAAVQTVCRPTPNPIHSKSET